MKLSRYKDAHLRVRPGQDIVHGVCRRPYALAPLDAGRGELVEGLARVQVHLRL